jgi:hypothetical protein
MLHLILTALPLVSRQSGSGSGSIAKRHLAIRAWYLMVEHAFFLNSGLSANQPRLGFGGGPRMTTTTVRSVSGCYCRCVEAGADLWEPSTL